MSIHNHIILPKETRSSLDFTTPRSGGGTGRIPVRNKDQHAQYLQSKFDEVWLAQDELRSQRAAIALPTRAGTYIEFKGKAGYELATQSLEDRVSGIRLLNVREIAVDNTIQQLATVFVPIGKENKFSRKLEDYRTRLTAKGNPSNDNLFRSIDDLQIANLHALWTGKAEQFPTNVISWYEVWVRTTIAEDNGEEQCRGLIANIRESGVEVKDNHLLFQERAVILCRLNLSLMTEMLSKYDCLAEFRPASTPASFWYSESRVEQNEWIQDLLNRLEVDDSHNVLACMLDSGINNGHPLLAPLIPDENCLTALPNAGTYDLGEGHGTQMAGIIEYENLEEKLESQHKIRISNRLCSVKMLPNSGQNPPDLYGPITQQSISRAEITFPADKKIYCMAVTAADSEKGQPSSWSGAIDQLVFNNAGEKRLMLISAGNIRYENINFDIWRNYPAGNNMRPVQDPAQSWNALTIGAYTEKMAVGEKPHYGRVASTGGISPYSTTSVIWPNSAPIKPEVVFEGGNLFSANDNNIPFTPGEELEALTTNAQYLYRKPLTTLSATSLATAIATAKGSRLLQKYPDLWPETVRALFVHSAEWTNQMKLQFPATTKTELRTRLRSVGYGVPNEDKMLNSKDNALSMITQAEIQPYIKRGSKQPSLNEMHLIELPWPTDILAELGESIVKIKITLSYFIEPSPGEVGWKDKYRYQSCGLRFELNDINEDIESFKKRINKRMRDEDDGGYRQADSSRWNIGSNNRDVGSIHCDYIEDSAINLVGCKYLAVYPVGGWWKSRTNLKMYNKKVRYSLIVSLDTLGQEIDIYTPVKTMIDTMVQIPIEVPVQQ